MLKRIHPQVLTLVIMSLFAHATLSGGRIASSLFVLQNGYSEFIAGLTYGLYSLMPALLALHIGRLVDQIGSRRIMKLSLLIMVIGLALPTIHLSLYSVFLCAAFGGLGFGGYILSAHVAISSIKVKQNSERTGMFAWLQMGTAVSAVAGPSLIGFIIDNNNFTIAYLCLTCVVSLGLLIAFTTVIPENKNTKENNNDSKLVKEVLHDKTLLKIYLLSMAVYLAWDCFAFMIPVLGTERGFSASSIGIILSFFAAGTFIVRALQTWLSRRSSEWNTLRLSYALSTLVFFLLCVANHMIFLCILSLLFGIAAGVGHPNILNLLLAYVPTNKSGEASGLRLMTGNIAGLLGTAACGAITTISGIFPVLLGIASIMGISSWYSRDKTHSSHQKRDID